MGIISQLVTKLVNEINEHSRVRVWSVIITVFGDCVLPRGGEISLGSLQEIMNAMLIEPNAVRTALSRLAKDNWLDRNKQGRQTSYRLAGGGMVLSQAASKRIYLLDFGQWREEFEVVLVPADEAGHRSRIQNDLAKAGYGSPLQGLYIRPKTGTPPPIDSKLYVNFSVASDKINLIEKLVSTSWPVDELDSAYHEFCKHFEPVASQMKRGLFVSNLECLAIRILLIHDWRRIVLKDVQLPDALRPSDWIGHKARKLVAELYHLLLPSSEACLNALHSQPDQPLPEPDDSVLMRFPNQ